MYQPMKRGRERAADLIERSGYGKPHMAHGGHEDFAKDSAMIREAVKEHEEHMHKGEKPTRIHFRDGGHADGEMAPHRLDHKARGGKTKGKHSGPQINIAVVPHAGMGGPGGPGMAGPPPVAMPPHPVVAAPPVAAPPPRPPMGAGPMPGAPPGGMGMPGGVAPRPMGVMHTGGRARRKDGGMMGDGGIGGSPRMTAGAGSGEGRREKMAREHSERWGDGA